MDLRRLLDRTPRTVVLQVRLSEAERDRLDAHVARLRADAPGSWITRSSLARFAIENLCDELDKGDK